MMCNYKIKHLITLYDMYFNRMLRIARSATTIVVSIEGVVVDNSTVDTGNKLSIAGSDLLSRGVDEQLDDGKERDRVPVVEPKEERVDDQHGGLQGPKDRGGRGRDDGASGGGGQRDRGRVDEDQEVPEQMQDPAIFWRNLGLRQPTVKKKKKGDKLRGTSHQQGPKVGKTATTIPRPISNFFRVRGAANPQGNSTTAGEPETSTT